MSSNTHHHNPWENSANISPVTPVVAARQQVWDIRYKRVFSVWPWMLVSAVLFFGIAFVSLRYIPPIYSSSISATIGENQEISLGQAFFSSRDPLNSQIATLTSPTLLKKVVDSIGLQFHAVRRGAIKNNDLYQVVKWKIISSTITEKQSLLNFQVEPKGNNRFEWQAGKQYGTGFWGEPFDLAGRKVVIHLLQPEFNNSFECYQTDDWNEAIFLSKTLVVKTSPESNVITLSLQDIQPLRSIEILNNLMDQYDDMLLEKKTNSIVRGLDFIEKTIEPLQNDVDSLETDLARYKAGKGFVGTSANGAIYLGKTQLLDEEIAKLDYQKKIFDAVVKYIRSPSVKDENLSLIGLSDPYLQGLMEQYQALRQEKEKISLVVTDENPQWQLLLKQLLEVRRNLDIQVENYSRNLRIAENNLQEKMQQAQILLANTPEDERELLERFRKREIKLALYQQLLQKKAEAGIALASIDVNTQVIAPARSSGSPVSPKRQQVILGSVLFGLLLPLGLTMVRELLNNNVISKLQLEQMVLAPVLAEIELIKQAGKEELVSIDSSDRSMFGEQIRSLRASLGYYSNSKSLYVMITSSMSGEGKSFIAANLARSFALQGKRTALVEFDLRRPKITGLLKLPKRIGVVNVLLGQLHPSDIIVRPFEGDDSLHVFPAGPVPPNPSELISNERLQVLKAYLDEHYDVVVVDTPPFGIVSDAQLLSSWSHVTLVITRFGITLREQVHEIETWRKKGVFKNMAIVFNGISSTGYYGYKYGAYYNKQRYGYNYYTKDKNK